MTESIFSIKPINDMENYLQEFIKKAEARGFEATKITESLYLFTKEGWPRFHYMEKQPASKDKISVPYLNPKAGQSVENWLVTLEQYLNGKVIVGAEDGTELGEYLQRFQERGYEIVQVGPRDYFVKAPNLVNMVHIWENAMTKDVKIEVLNQFV